MSVVSMFPPCFRSNSGPFAFCRCDTDNTNHRPCGYGNTVKIEEPVLYRNDADKRLLVLSARSPLPEE